MNNSKSAYFILSACLFLMLDSATARADFPARPVQLVVGYAPGGGGDTLARLVARKLSEKWHQPVLVENKLGADGNIAAAYVAHATPDGYTLFFHSNNLTIPTIGYKLEYDPLNGFSPITMVAHGPDLLLVNSSFPAQSLKEFIAVVKAKPGQYNYGSSGAGTYQWLEMQLLMNKTATNMVHITYKGGGPAVAALAGNEIQALFGAISGSLGQIQAGKLRPLGIAGDKRSPILPDVPTVSEAAGIPSFEAGWYGMFAPANTPKDVVNRIHDDVAEALKSSDVEADMLKFGVLAEGDTPEHFRQIVRDDLLRWAELEKSIDMK